MADHGAPRGGARHIMRGTPRRSTSFDRCTAWSRQETYMDASGQRAGLWGYSWSTGKKRTAPICRQVARRAAHDDCDILVFDRFGKSLPACRVFSLYSCVVRFGSLYSLIGLKEMDFHYKTDVTTKILEAGRDHENVPQLGRGGSSSSCRVRRNHENDAAEVRAMCGEAGATVFALPNFGKTTTRKLVALFPAHPPIRNKGSAPVPSSLFCQIGLAKVCRPVGCSSFPSAADHTGHVPPLTPHQTEISKRISTPRHVRIAGPKSN